jgi:aspartokinase
MKAEKQRSHNRTKLQLTLVNITVCTAGKFYEKKKMPKLLKKLGKIKESKENKSHYVEKETDVHTTVSDHVDKQTKIVHKTTKTINRNQPKPSAIYQKR